MYEIKAYQCAYCKKYSKSKSVMKKHESKCFYNPITRACATCANCIQEHYKVDKASLPPNFEGEVYSYRPMCKADQTISHLVEGVHKTNLRGNCKFWIKEKEED